MKRRWVKVVAGLAILIFALWGSFLGSGISSRNQVEKYKSQLHAAGEKLSFSEIAPAPVPAEENGAELFPALNSILNVKFNDALDTNSPPAMQMTAPGRAMISWQQPDVQSTEGSNSWSEIGTSLDRRAGAVDLLREMAERPKLVFDLNYEKGFMLLLPHLSKMKKTSQLLSTAMLFELHEGNASAAYTNLHVALTFVKNWNSEPLLISQLVRLAMTQILYNAQWEILQATNVTDSQLASLKKDWQEIELIKSAETSLVGERVFAISMLNWLRTSNNPSAVFSMLAGTGSSSGSGDLWDDLKETGMAAKHGIADQFWKTSWSYSDELYLLRADQVLITALREVQANGFFNAPLAERTRRLDDLSKNGGRENWLRLRIQDETIAFSNISDSLAHELEKVLFAEAARQLAITAIALRRYQLQHGNAPDRLSALVPEFLESVPRDPVDGNPLRYRLNPDGTFLLYSIGEDGKDDGGNPAPTSTSARSFNMFRARDWVWPQPATEAEVQFYRETESSHR